MFHHYCSKALHSGKLGMSSLCKRALIIGLGQLTVAMICVGQLIVTIIYMGHIISFLCLFVFFL